MLVAYLALCVVYFAVIEAGIIPEGAQKTPVILGELKETGRSFSIPESSLDLKNVMGATGTVV